MREGLGRAMLVPIGTAWADIYGGATRQAGPFIRGEVGVHPWRQVGVYGFGEVARNDAVVGAGIHFEIP